MSYVRLGGKVNFIEDSTIVNHRFAESPVLTSQFEEQQELIVAYYLIEAWAESNSFTDGLPHRNYSLGNKFDREIQA